MPGWRCGSGSPSTSVWSRPVGAFSQRRPSSQRARQHVAVLPEHHARSERSVAPAVQRMGRSLAVFDLGDVVPDERQVRGERQPIGRRPAGTHVEPRAVAVFGGVGVRAPPRLLRGRAAAPRSTCRSSDPRRRARSSPRARRWHRRPSTRGRRRGRPSRPRPDRMRADEAMRARTARARAFATQTRLPAAATNAARRLTVGRIAGEASGGPGNRLGCAQGLVGKRKGSAIQRGGEWLGGRGLRRREQRGAELSALRRRRCSLAAAGAEGMQLGRPLGAGARIRLRRTRQRGRREMRNHEEEREEGAQALSCSSWACTRRERAPLCQTRWP